jgi:hypothetical protein
MERARRSSFVTTKVSPSRHHSSAAPSFSRQDVGEGKTEVAAIDPVASMQAIDNPKLAATAKQVQTMLKQVIEGL